MTPEVIAALVVGVVLGACVGLVAQVVSVEAGRVALEQELEDARKRHRSAEARADELRLKLRNGDRPTASSRTHHGWPYSGVVHVWMLEAREPDCGPPPGVTWSGPWHCEEVRSPRRYLWSRAYVTTAEPAVT